MIWDGVSYVLVAEELSVMKQSKMSLKNTASWKFHELTSKTMNPISIVMQQNQEIRAEICKVLQHFQMQIFVI
jgi:hypothetical protein